MVNTVRLGVVEVCMDWWCGDIGERIIMVLNFGLHESFFDAILIMVLTRVMDVR